MRFHITKLSINRYWVNCDQVSFWFQNPKDHLSGFQIHQIAMSTDVTLRLSLPGTAKVPSLLLSTISDQ
jgi:hypothetical protein